MFMQKFTRSNLFRHSYFRVLIVGHENCENLNLAKISCYTAWENHVTYFKQRTCILVLWCHCENHSPLYIVYRHASSQTASWHTLVTALCLVVFYKKSWLISLTPSGLKTATQGLQAEKEVRLLSSANSVCHVYDGFPFCFFFAIFLWNNCWGFLSPPLPRAKFNSCLVQLRLGGHIWGETLGATLSGWTTHSLLLSLPSFSHTYLHLFSSHYFDLPWAVWLCFHSRSMNWSWWN